jgi:ferric-dicitrate binding protein FerR (iron transport regulator)
VEEQRDADHDQAAGQAEKASGPARMFGAGTERADEVDRINRRRIALLGLATGALMAGIVLLCILLLFLAVGSGNSPS